MMNFFSDDELRDWLLHRLDPARTDALEEQLIGDDTIADRIRDARCDLFDDYARDLLDTETRRLFVAHCLASSADRDRLAFANALAKLPAQKLPTHTPRASPLRTRTRAWALGSALAAAVSAGLVLAWLRIDTGDVARPTHAGAQLPTIALMAASLRGSAATDLNLPTGGALRLQAEIDAPGAQSRYTLRILDDATELFRAEHLMVHRAGPFAFVEIEVPTALLGPGRRSIIADEEGTSRTSAARWTITTHAPVR
jgi:hypothetical protein